MRVSDESRAPAWVALWMTEPPNDTDDIGGGKGGVSPWIRWVQTPGRHPGGELLKVGG